MLNPDRKNFIPFVIRQEIQTLKDQGIRSSHAHEIVARSRGFNTYIGLRNYYLNGGV